MNDAAVFVGLEGGLLENVIEIATVADLDKVKIGIGVIFGLEFDRAHTDQTVKQGTPQFEIHDTEHIQIINFSAEDTPAVLDTVR